MKIRTYHTMRLLTHRFRVTALCFYRWKKGLLEQDLAPSIEALREHVDSVEAFPIPQEHEPWRFYYDHLRSVLTIRAYTRYVYDSKPFHARLQALLSDHKFDLIHADSLDLARYFSAVRSLPLVCVHHDVQSKLLQRRAAQEISYIRRTYTELQARLMKAEEQRWCGKVSLNVTVSDVDRRHLSHLVPAAKVHVVPNGVDVDTFKPRDRNQQDDLVDVVFVGGTSWFPNLDALRYFSEDILPRLRTQLSTVSVRWVGRATKEEIRFFGQRYGIHLTGYVPDVRPHLAAAACVVVPLRVGGGTRIKILDAWAMGKAVVSTQVGCEGLAAVDGENILIASDADEFATDTVTLIQDPGLRGKLEHRARHTAETYYSWDRVGRQMNERYLRVISEH